MPALPSSLSAILSLLQPAFTAPTFQIFGALLHGFIGRIGEHTVTGMWQAARLAGHLHHSRAHDFFARAAWCPDRLGLLVLNFLLEAFLDPGAPIALAVDGSVFKRSGSKVHGASWHHDSAAPPGGRGFRFGNCFVVVGLVVRIPALGRRAWCLPVLFRLWLPTPKPTEARPDPPRRPFQQDLAAQLIAKVAERCPQRRIDVLGDSAFACKAMAPSSNRVTLTSRLRSNAVIHGPRPTGRRGRPRVKGERLGTPAEIAARAKASEWQRLSVPGRGEVEALVVEGLWYSVFGPQAVRVVIAREPSDAEGYRIALISTDVEAGRRRSSPATPIAARSRSPSRTPSRRSGSGEARNRVQRAVTCQGSSVIRNSG